MFCSKKVLTGTAVLAAVIALVAGSTPLRAQATGGEINGVVLDAQKAVKQMLQMEQLEEVVAGDNFTSLTGSRLPPLIVRVNLISAGPYASRAARPSCLTPRFP